MGAKILLLSILRQHLVSDIKPYILVPGNLSQELKRLIERFENTIECLTNLEMNPHDPLRVRFPTFERAQMRENGRKLGEAEVSTLVLSQNENHPEIQTFHTEFLHLSHVSCIGVT
jgi:hypothetical protein